MIYFIQRPDGLIKIGTTRNWAQRRAQLWATEGRFEFLLEHVGNHDMENALHKKFAHCKAPYKNEWFYPAPDLLDYIDRYRNRDKIPMSLADLNRHTNDLAALESEIETLESEVASAKKELDEVEETKAKRDYEIAYYEGRIEGLQSALNAKKGGGGFGKKIFRLLVGNR